MMALPLAQAGACCAKTCRLLARSSGTLVLLLVTPTCCLIALHLLAEV